MLLLKLIILGGVLLYLYNTVNLNALVMVFKKVSFINFMISSSFIVGGIGIIGMRWQYALKATLNIDISHWESFVQNYKTYGIGQVLPGYLSGDIYRTYAISSAAGLKDALGIIFLDRIFALIISIILGLGVAPLFMHELLDTGAGNTLLFLLFSIFSFLAGIFILKKPLTYFFPDIERFYDYFLCFFKKEYIAKIMIFYGLVDIAFIIPIYILAQSMDVCLNFTTCCLLMPVIFLSAALPISFAGWGVREGVFVTFLVLFGVSKEVALALSLTYGLVGLVAALPALIFIFIPEKKINVSRKKIHERSFDRS